MDIKIGPNGGIIGGEPVTHIISTISPPSNALSIVNGTSAQTLNIYNTYTDSSNYEVLKAYWSGTYAYLVTNQNGSGATRGLVIGTIGSAFLSFTTGNIIRWSINNGGSWEASANNTYDIGRSNLLVSPRALYLGTSLEVQTIATLGSESLHDGAFTDEPGHAAWAVANGFSIASTKATYAYNASGGTLTQASASLAVVLRGSRWYKLVYTVSGTTGTVGAVTIPATVATAATALTITNAVGAIVYFKTVAAPTDFVISAAAGSEGCAFSLDDLSLKEITGGNANVGGYLELGNANTTVTNDYVVAGGQAATTHNTGWLPVYVNGTLSWVPYWSNATP